MKPILLFFNLRQHLLNSLELCLVSLGIYYGLSIRNGTNISEDRLVSGPLPNTWPGRTPYCPSHCWLHLAARLGNCPASPCSWRGIGTNIGTGHKSTVIFTVTTKTNYYAWVFLFLRMNGLGDSTHELISTRKLSKLVPTAGSTGAPLQLQPGQVHPCKWKLKGDFGEESERRGADWLSGLASIGAVDRDTHQLLQGLVLLSGTIGGWWRQMWSVVACVIHRNRSCC